MRIIKLVALVLATSTSMVAGVFAQSVPTTGSFRLEAFARHEALAKATPYKNIRWRNIGPDHISGRVTEHWSVIGGAAWQDAKVTRDIQTSASSSSLIPQGTVLPQVPRRSFSLWNRYDFNPRWGVGLGVVARSDVYTSTSNTVRLPGYARVDAAVFWKPVDELRVQLNIENLLDREYFPTAHSNTNISPGSPRAFTLGLHYGF